MWPFGEKSTVHKLDDKVWGINEKKYVNLLVDAKRYTDEGKFVFLACYFPDTLNYITSILEGSNSNFIKIHDNYVVDQNKINLIEAYTLLSKKYIDKLSQETHEIIILFAEHYPIYSVEKEIFDVLNTSKKNISYCFYISLDEPLFKRFGAERIMELMTKMGMEKDEMISHAFISAAIVNAQKKIESRASSEIKADSAEEWFIRNIKPIENNEH